MPNQIDSMQLIIEIGRVFFIASFPALLLIPGIMLETKIIKLLVQKVKDKDYHYSVLLPVILYVLVMGVMVVDLYLMFFASINDISFHTKLLLLKLFVPFLVFELALSYFFVSRNIVTWKQLTSLSYFDGN
jgi:hypothetical protein